LSEGGKGTDKSRSLPSTPRVLVDPRTEMTGQNGRVFFRPPTGVNTDPPGVRARRLDGIAGVREQTTRDTINGHKVHCSASAHRLRSRFCSPEGDYIRKIIYWWRCGACEEPSKAVFIWDHHSHHHLTRRRMQPGSPRRRVGL